ncbi:MAG: hypothetical protein K2L93_02885 [Muribaculaceae bacterium]|nr:hypothetical protein [Muribaculaceae bacterium]
MKEAKNSYRNMVAAVPGDTRDEIKLSFDIAGRIDSLMHERGLTKSNLLMHWDVVQAKSQNG